MADMATGKHAWTQKNLHRLFTAMKTNISKHERNVQYGKSLKTLDWNKVAFPPFSPKECEEKWSEILYKMRKLRSLTELLNEAEDALSNSQQIHPLFLKRPKPPCNMYFEETHTEFRKKHPELKPNMLFKLALNRYKDLPQKEKAKYSDKFKLANKEYQSKKDQFRKSEASADVNDQSKSRLMDEDLPAKLYLTGYNVFCKDQYSCIKNATAGNIFKKFAEQWRSLSSTEKLEYTKKCKAIKLQYKTKQAERRKNFTSCKTKHETPTSDSDDEDVEDSSSEDEQNFVNFNEEEDDDEEENDEDEDMEAEDL